MRSSLDLGNNRVLVAIGASAGVTDPSFRVSEDSGQSFTIATTMADAAPSIANARFYQIASTGDGNVIAATRYGSTPFEIWLGVLPQVSIGTETADFDLSRVRPVQALAGDSHMVQRTVRPSRNLLQRFPLVGPRRVAKFGDRS